MTHAPTSPVSHEALVLAVEAAAPAAVDPDEIQGYEEASADWRLPRMHRASVPEGLTKNVVAELRRIGSVARLEGGIAHSSPSSHGSISLDQIAHWLIAQARFRAAKSCVEDLFTHLQRNESPLIEVVPIWGMTPRTAIDLGNGIQVIPTAALPDSKLKDMFLAKKRHRFSFDIANSSPRPGAAIVRLTQHGPVYDPVTSKAAARSRLQSDLMLRVVTSPSEADRQSAMRQLAELMPTQLEEGLIDSIGSLANELADVIALFTPKPLIPVGHWYQRPEYLPLVGLLGGYSGPTNEHPLYLEIPPQEYATSEIQDTVRRYQALPEKTRRQLRTPLRRLNQGRRQLQHHTVEAAAIELGIAAEALLTQDREKDAPISFTLRARGTLLVGGSPEVRRRTYQTLRDLYDLRSTVAHEGFIVEHQDRRPSRKDQERMKKARDTADAGQALCTAMIRKVIELGEIPPWDSLLLGL